MKNKIALIILLSYIMILPAMQKPDENIFVSLPVELQYQIMPYVIGNNLNEAVNDVKRLYVVSPGIRSNIHANQVILNYIIQKFKVDTSKELQKIVNNLNAFEVFKNSEFKALIETKKQELDRMQKLVGELKSAIQQNDLARIQQLIQQGVNVNALYIADEYMLDYKFPPLIHAYYDPNNKNLIETLLKAGANINAQDTEGKTILSLAVQEILSRRNQENRNIDFVKLLLEKGASPNLGKAIVRFRLMRRHIAIFSSPLGAAKDRGNEELVELLMQYNAKRIKVSK